MVISSKLNTKKSVCDTLELSNETISASSSVRNLGVIMDKNMQMDDHINQVRKSAFYYLNWIHKICPFLTKKTTKSVVRALVISKVNYCNSLLVNLPAKYHDRLQNILHCAARLITGVSKYDHIV